MVQRFGNEGSKVWFGNPPSAAFGYMVIYGFFLLTLLQILMIMANDKSPFMVNSCTIDNAAFVFLFCTLFANSCVIPIRFFYDFKRAILVEF